MNKFYSREITTLRNKALWLYVVSHVTSFNESEYIN